MKKFATVFSILAAVFLAGTAEAAVRYAKLTATAVGNGKVAVNTSATTPASNQFGASKNVTQNEGSNNYYGTTPTTITLYAFEQADAGYVFIGWSETENGPIVGTQNPISIAIPVGSSNNSTGNAAPWNLYAHFVAPVCRVVSTGTTYGTLEAAFEAAAATDTVELLKNVTLDENTKVPRGKNITLTSESGHSYTVTRGGTGVAFEVYGAVTLANVTVDGASLNGTSAMFSVQPNGTFTLNDGAEIRNCKNVSTSGGAIFADAGSTVNLAGGTIANCSAAQGGAVYLAQGRTAYATYYRLTIRKTYNNNATFDISEFILKDASGNRINGGTSAYTFDGTYTTTEVADAAISALEPGHVIMTGGTVTFSAGDPSNLFDGVSDANHRMAISSPTFNNQVANNRAIVFRVPDGSNPAVSYQYNYGSTRNYNPTSLKIERSFDGVTWTSIADNSTLNRPGNNDAYKASSTFNTSPADSGHAYAAAVLNVSGDPAVTDNHALDGTTLNNVQPVANNQIHLVGDFSGTVGVSWPATNPEGAQFGVTGSTFYTGFKGFSYDLDNHYAGKLNGSALIWKTKTPEYPDEDRTFAEILAETDPDEDPVTVEISENVGTKVDIEIPAGRDVIIDLKGHTLTADITATGNVTITDSSESKTGKLVGDIIENGGTVKLEWGTYTTEIKDEWPAQDRVVIRNYNGTKTVTVLGGESDIHSCTLDTRLGVRLVNDPAEDIIPLTYASSNFVYRMSEDYAKNTFVGVAPAYPPAPLTEAEWHNGLTNVSAVADSDKSYDYPTGNWRITHDPFVEVYNGPGEASVVWQEWCWGLIEAIHSNQCGVIRAWYKFPDPQFRVTQRDASTRNQQKTEGSVSDGNVYWEDETGTDQNKNKYDIELSYKYLEDNYKFSRIGGDKEDSMESLEKIRDHLDDWCDNGLRVWENLVTGTDPDKPYIADVDSASAGTPTGTGSGTANPNTFVTSMPSVHGTDDFFGYDYWYDLRRATNWWNLVTDTRDKTPRKVVPLYADDNDNSRDPTGLYKVFTLIVPDTRKAITNEIPTKNVIGVLKVESTMTNTMVNIPWKSLAHDPEFLLPQTVVSNLTKTTNLEVGDRVYVLDGNYKGDDTDLTTCDYYQAWVLNANYKWQPINTLKVNEYGTNLFTKALSPEQKQLFRGGGVWVVRNHPTRIDPKTGKEVAKPFFIYGQFETNNVSTTINGSDVKDQPVYTMLGIPGIYGIDINKDINWGNNPIEDTDVITIPRETAEPFKLRWKVINGVGSWGYTETTVIVDPKTKRRRTQSVRVTDVQVPRGHAFWYTRRGPSFNFTWKLSWPKAGLEEYFGWEKYPEESKPKYDPPAVIGD